MTKHLLVLLLVLLYSRKLNLRNNSGLGGNSVEAAPSNISMHRQCILGGAIVFIFVVMGGSLGGYLPKIHISD
jgi:hypothetical protein